MRFHCFYQTSDNANRDEWIEARDRNDAYAKLKARGIRPYRVVGRDPRRLPRWALVSLISLLALLLLSTILYPLSTILYPLSTILHPLSTILHPLSTIHYPLSSINSSPAPLPRAQIYGDTETLQLCERAGWTNVFASAGDAWLARHARPGIACDCGREGMWRAEVADALVAGCRSPLPPPAGAPEEHVKMVRMVNGMKEELVAFLEGGGTVADYMMLCCERLRTEEGVAERIAEEFDRLRADSEKMTREAVVSEWEKKNRALRALGLPTVLLPAEFL